MNAWLCNRCHTVSTGGNVDDPPDNWRHTVMPTRGTEGYRDTTDVVICDDCDDSLYAWFTTGAGS